MTTATKAIAAMLCAAAAGAHAQAVLPPPQNVLQLSASHTVEVTQDLLSMRLAATRDGADPGQVQAQLKTALDAALAEAKRVAEPGQLDVRTGNFSLYPRHGRDGRISGWQGTAELVLEGRDIARISQLAGRIQTMTLAGVGFGLSREQRAATEAQAQGVAIEQFKAKAGELARGFGFGGWSLREVAVQANDQRLPRPMAMEMRSADVAAAAAPVPVEAGKAAVTVTVSGTVQLR